MEPDGRQGIQSLDSALLILKALIKHRRPMSLKELAAAAGMTSSNTHRYLVSFVRGGMLRQERVADHYELGPGAVQLGLAALAGMDHIEIAAQVLAELRDEIDMPVFLSIWTPDGPVMIRWLESSHPLTVNIRPGSRASLLNAASGRVFLAFEDYARVKPLLDAELQMRRKRKEPLWTTLAEAEAIRNEALKYGVGRTLGERVHGVYGISAPVFNALGQLVASITSVGLAADFDPAYDGPLAAAVKAAGNTASQRLGYDPALSTRE